MNNDSIIDSIIINNHSLLNKTPNGDKLYNNSTFIDKNVDRNKTPNGNVLHNPPYTNLNDHDKYIESKKFYSYISNDINILFPNYYTPQKEININQNN